MEWYGSPGGNSFVSQKLHQEMRRRSLAPKSSASPAAAAVVEILAFRISPTSSMVATAALSRKLLIIEHKNKGELCRYIIVVHNSLTDSTAWRRGSGVLRQAKHQSLQCSVDIRLNSGVQVVRLLYITNYVCTPRTGPYCISTWRRISLHH